MAARMTTTVKQQPAMASGKTKESVAPYSPAANTGAIMAATDTEALHQPVMVAEFVHAEERRGNDSTEVQIDHASVVEEGQNHAAR